MERAPSGARGPQRGRRRSGQPRPRRSRGPWPRRRSPAPRSNRRRRTRHAVQHGREHAETGDGRPEPQRPAHVASEERLDPDGGHECGQEHERLQARRAREEHRTDEQCLSHHRGTLEGCRQRPRRENEHRQKRDLRHDHAAVEQARQRERQGRSDERPALSGQPATPEEDRDGGQRHDDGLDSLQNRVPEAQVVQAERRARRGPDRRRSRSRIGRRDPQLTGRRQRLWPSARVDRLVRSRSRGRRSSFRPSTERRRSSPTRPTSTSQTGRGR